MAPRCRAPLPSSSSSSSSSSVVTEERDEEEVWKPSMAKKSLEKKKKTRAKKGAPVTVAALHAAVEAAAATRIPWTKVEAVQMLKAAEVLVSEKESEMTKVMRSFDQDITTLREILALLRDGMRQSFNWHSDGELCGIIQKSQDQVHFWQLPKKMF
ncbi:uncharacterized protein [Elaeis guineensis]